MTRVIVADDQALVREGIRTLLEVAGVEVVAEAEDGAQAVAVIEEHAPEVALMDLRMPRHDGIWALEQLREQGSAVPVGLFGEQRKTRSGSAARACSTAEPTSRSKVPASRCPSTHRVPRDSTMIGCIE